MAVERVLYFEKAGEENTDEALRIAKEYADKHGIRSIVVASTRGKTAEKALEYFGEGYNLVVVTHEAWFRPSVRQEFDEEIRRKLVSRGVKVVTAAHAFRGVDRAVRDKYGGLSPADLIADVLRLFCQGVKVCVEIVLMAADAGCIPLDDDVIAIGGTGRGADTVLLVKPSTSRRLFDLKIRKILAKPI